MLPGTRVMTTLMAANIGAHRTETTSIRLLFRPIPAKAFVVRRQVRQNGPAQFQNVDRALSSVQNLAGGSDQRRIGHGGFPGRVEGSLQRGSVVGIEKQVAAGAQAAVAIEHEG